MMGQPLHTTTQMEQQQEQLGVRAAVDAPASTQVHPQLHAHLCLLKANSTHPCAHDFDWHQTRKKGCQSLTLRLVSAAKKMVTDSAWTILCPSSWRGTLEPGAKVVLLQTYMQVVSNNGPLFGKPRVDTLSVQKWYVKTMLQVPPHEKCTEEKVLCSSSDNLGWIMAQQDL